MGRNPKFKLDRLAKSFPVGDDASFDALCEDIRLHGQRQKGIVRKLPNGKLSIIDGQRRYLACERIGKPFQYEIWDGKGSLTDLVASLNLQRRHMSDDQRAIHAARLYPAIIEQTKTARASKGGRAKAGETAAPDVCAEQKRDTRQVLAQAAGVSRAKLVKAIAVISGKRALARQVAEGKINLGFAFRQVRRAQVLLKFREMARSAPARPDTWDIRAGDFLKLANPMPRRSCRLIFADPRYNIGIDYGRGPDADRQPEKDYLAWCLKWMRECVELLTPDGSMWVMIDHSHVCDFGVMLREVGLHFRSLIVWAESFATYKANNFTALRFIHYYTRDTKNFVFNGDEIKIPSWRNLNDPHNLRTDKSGRLPPGLWGGKDDPLHRVVSGSEERDEFFPTQLPVELLARVVKCASDPGDLVFDPFTGSGTTGIAAIRNGRRFLGTEIHPPYAGRARLRMRAEVAAHHQSATPPLNRAQPICSDEQRRMERRKSA